MSVVGPVTGYQATDPNTNNAEDLGSMFVSKDYMLDAYPNLVPGRTSPGLWAWGDNYQGALGIGNTTNYSSPVQVGALTTWKQISAGGATVGGVKNDGTLWMWAYNGFGNVGNGTNGGNVSTPVQVGSLTNWKQVAAGEYVTHAIQTNGTLWSWGAGGASGATGAYQLGLGSVTSSYSSPVQVGALTTWKYVTQGGSGTGTTSLNSSAALQTNGTLWTWGYNSSGQLGNGTTSTGSSPVQIGATTTWKHVSVGFSHDAAIQSNGTLWIWGSNTYGQLGNSTITNYSSPIQVGALTNWQYVSCGYHTTFAIQSNGTLWAWGLNKTGQLGLGAATTVFYSSPVQVGSLTNWKLVSASTSLYQVSPAIGGSAMALRTDGTLWGWGGNLYGQLGLGVTANYSSPVQVGSLTTWKSVSAGFWTLAIADGYI